MSAVEVSSCLAPLPALLHSARAALTARLQAIIGQTLVEARVPRPCSVRVCPRTPTLHAPALEDQPTTQVQAPRRITVLPPKAIATCTNQYLRPVPIPIASAPRRLALTVLQAAVPAVPAQLQAITGTIQMEGPLPLQVRVLV